MNYNVEYIIDDVIELKSKIIQWSNKFTNVAILESNNYSLDKYSKHEYIAAIGSEKEILLTSTHNSFSKLKTFTTENNNTYIFGYLSYDLKNDKEELFSENKDELHFPELHFFIPKYLLKISSNILSISSNCNNIDETYNAILAQQIASTSTNKIEFNSVFTKNKYVETVNNLKHHIQLGNIYEANFCQEFYAKPKYFDPSKVFNQLLKESPSPFSTYYKLNNSFLMSASPERFVTKIDDKIYSQPIKGTIKRDSNILEDNKLIEQLKNDTKELSENVMIVDLVRNDMSIIAKKATVKVEELFGIYSFPQVHQMISTISAEVDADLNNVDIIKSLFPMGSMTGAPKIRAMQLIEEFEETKRGLFSGSVGYFEPNGNFDFNVIIRSLFYNKTDNYLSFQVGSAITINSDANKEYDECLVKAKAMLLATNAKIKKEH